MISNRKILLIVIIGDIICIALVALIGFLIHYGDTQGWRWLSSFIPVVIAWFVTAPWVGAYQADTIRRPLLAWRAGLAAFLSAPLAAWLRGIWLNSAVLPVFINVLILTNVFGFIVWRVLLAFVLRWTSKNG